LASLCSSPSTMYGTGLLGNESLLGRLTGCFGGEEF
jgi:hypothetical protein